MMKKTLLVLALTLALLCAAAAPAGASLIYKGSTDLSTLEQDGVTFDKASRRLIFNNASIETTNEYNVFRITDDTVIEIVLVGSSTITAAPGVKASAFQVMGSLMISGSGSLDISSGGNMYIDGDLTIDGASVSLTAYDKYSTGLSADNLTMTNGAELSVLSDSDIAAAVDIGKTLRLDGGSTLDAENEGEAHSLRVVNEGTVTDGSTIFAAGSYNDTNGKHTLYGEVVVSKGGALVITTDEDDGMPEKEKKDESSVRVHGADGKKLTIKESADSDDWTMHYAHKKDGGNWITIIRSTPKAASLPATGDGSAPVALLALAAAGMCAAFFALRRRKG